MNLYDTVKYYFTFLKSTFILGFKGMDFKYQIEVVIFYYFEA